MQFIHTQVETEDNCELDDIDLAPLQLIRRQGFMIEELQEDKILKCIQISSSKIYASLDCPICLCPSDNVPLKCGHAFCSADVGHLLDQSNNQIIQCPICRQHQQINQIDELYELKEIMTY